jgi:hypothetical protein
MKKLMMLAVAMLALNIADAPAQSFMQKLGKEVKKEVKKEAEKEANRQVKKAVHNAFNPSTTKQEKPQPQKAQPTQAKQATTQKAAATVASKSNGEKKFVKNIDLYYKIGRVEGNYPLYYDGSSYYLDRKGEMLKLTPCDGEFMGKKYYFFCVMFDVELYINENLPGAVGKRVVKNDHDL